MSQVTTNFLGFVPALVIQHLINKKNSKHSDKKFPEKQTLKSIVMFADISGFTALTENLSKMGPEGAELIAFAINRYMELMVKEIVKSGGDIFKYVGDAMIVVWPPPKDKDNQESIKILARQAIQSALEIQEKLNNTNLIQDIKLSVKIGFGYGEFQIIYVGGVFGRAEYLPVGDPLIQSFQSEERSGKGLVVISEEMKNLVGNTFIFEEIQEGKNHQVGRQFYKVYKMNGEKVKSKADAYQIFNDILKASELEVIKKDVMQFCPAAILPYINIDQESWASELRKLSVMFINLQIDLAKVGNEEGLNHLQNVIERIQKCIYFHEGSLNKFLMDDKGSTLIVVFGLPFISHQDDTVRAVLCGFSMSRELEKLNCKCFIGISTGIVFTGVVGTTGSRREYSVIGDSVNLAARIMSEAKQEKIPMLVSQATALYAQSKIQFQYWAHKQFKGFQSQLPIFLPIENDKAIDLVNNSIRTHSFSIEKRGNDTQFTDFNQTYYMEGRKKELDECRREIERFMNSGIHTGFTLIRGSMGMGKSLLVKKILQKSSSRLETIYKYGEKPEILISTLNEQSKKLKLNGIRQILQQLFRIYQYRINFQSENLQDLKSLLKKIIPDLQNVANNQNFEESIYEIFGIIQYDPIKNFPQIPQNLTEQIIKNEGKKYAFLIQQFLEKFLEQDKFHIEERLENKTRIIKNYDDSIAPYIFCLEDLQDYDIRIYIIATQRDEFVEKPIFTDPKQIPQEKIIEQSIYKIEDLFKFSNQPFFKQIDIKPLDSQGMWDAIKKTYNIISLEFESNNNQQNNNFYQYIDNQENLNQKYKPWNFERFKQNKEINPEEYFLSFLLLKMEGNIQRSMDFIDAMLDSKQIWFKDIRNHNRIRESQIINKNKAPSKNKQDLCFVISDHLKAIVFIEDLLTIEVPFLSYQINSPIIDQLDCHEILLMKQASVIGDIFCIQRLAKINPFKNVITTEKVKQILYNLTEKDFLEILDQTDSNITYRFGQSFMREVLYQRMTYTQRRSIHTSVADSLQTIPQDYGIDDNTEEQILNYHWYLSSQRDRSTQKVDFSNAPKSHKAKRSIIVKKITKELARNQHSVVKLHETDLYKKSDSNVTWSKRFTILSTVDLRYYYTKSDFINSPENPLAVIPLRHIYQITPLKEKSIGDKQYAFEISSTLWLKKEIEQRDRKFYFATENDEDLERWTIYIEFARAKAVYDEFTKQFGKIQFPMKIQLDTDLQLTDLQKVKKVTRSISNVDPKQSINYSRRTTKAISIQKTLTLKRDESSISQILEKQQYAQSDINQLKEQVKIFVNNSMVISDIFRRKLSIRIKLFKLINILIRHFLFKITYSFLIYSSNHCKKRKMTIYVLVQEPNS